MAIGTRNKGTCYHPRHWLNTQNCETCNLLEECINLNKEKAGSEVIPPKPKTAPVTKLITEKLLQGASLDNIVNFVLEQTNEKNASKIRGYTLGMIKSIRKKEGKYGRAYEIISEDFDNMKIKETK